VAANLTSLGSSVDTYGLIGDDRDGKQLIKMLEEKDINSFLIKSDNDKRTTVKTRIIADE